MQTDARLQHDILAELRWEPSVTHDHIHVAVADGIVTLSGVAANYAEKIAAEKVARRVSGVRAIADEIDVGAASANDHDDTSVARRVASVLEWHVSVPAGRIRTEVEKGIVTLTGRVDWKFQSDAARKAIAGIAGVTGIANLLEVHNPVCAQDIRDGIEAAYKRLASLDIDAIAVDIDGSRVILTGRVTATTSGTSQSARPGPRQASRRCATRSSSRGDAPYCGPVIGRNRPGLSRGYPDASC